MTKVWIQNQPRIDGISSQNYYNTQKKLNLTIPKKVSFEGEMVKPNEWLDNFSCFEKEMKRGFFQPFIQPLFFKLNSKQNWTFQFYDYWHFSGFRHKVSTSAKIRRSKKRRLFGIKRHFLGLISVLHFRFFYLLPCSKW